MTRWIPAIAEFLAGAAFVVASILCWRNGIHSVWFAPAGDAPGFTATRYSGPWLSGAAVLMAVAGLTLIDVVGRTVRHARSDTP